jgi:hypothetical protein
MLHGEKEKKKSSNLPHSRVSAFAGCWFAAAAAVNTCLKPAAISQDWFKIASAHHTAQAERKQKWLPQWIQQLFSPKELMNSLNLC